ncbi:hypothetical protein CH373_03085 [Leptospira perolatii]|uniref:Uncharacterized protein n=1 Tax=Leptospira perolatii TaxID=2023191 RepID=A0A2M9ZT93_9LEPT|nr:hypothetical protein [Leptospira perolatii]PJZ71609.1 hypothetical protein CH360_03080 [Leptospira perolatii]PJZ75224.1 hypothetical protein CH373_03085 [Leptospira perolatii]
MNPAAKKRAKILGIFGFLILVAILSEGCRHAWVRYPQLPPEACRIYPSSRECRRALDARDTNQQSSSGSVHKIKQDYYFFGLYPGIQVLDTSQYCPDGPKLVHQYTSTTNAIWEQVSLGVYSPQTVEVECYP